MRIKTTVCQDQAGWTVERVLRQGLGVSRSLLRRAKQRRAILLDGQPVNSNVRVAPGAILEISMQQEVSSIVPEPMDLSIIYEDRDIMAVHKPPGMLVHPLTAEPTGTLANGVLYYWLQQGAPARFRPVHRIDRDTSGLVLVARNSYVHQQLQSQINQGLMCRRYLAMVTGNLAKQKGTITAPIDREAGSLIKRVVTPAGKPAITHYRVLRQLSWGSLIRVELVTGRTHQVRVHMSHIGHPLLGDDLYGGDLSLIKRQALHCAYLAFSHPVTGQLIKLACPLPGDMKALLNPSP